MTEIAQRPYPDDTASKLIQTGMPALLARIYAARGISAGSQLDTGLGQLLPYSLLKNATQMAVLLADAIAAKKSLLIVADYDADGATACAVGLRGLRAMGAKVDFIVPNRFEYGYGLTPEIVRLAAQFKPDIIVTVDNGIASVEGVAEAKKLGIEVLVTDHHLPGDSLPDALCIVNPNQPGCEFPSKNLAGVGVMFYVLLALRAELRTRGAFAGIQEPNLGNLLDIVALGTVADVVKLDENNRILVQQGLLRMRAGRACAGITALLHVAKKSAAQASAYEMGFIVGPRLNAAGRLEDMGLGIQCLLTDDPAEAEDIAARLDSLNQERRSIEADMQQAALAALENINPADGYSLALFDEGWHQGVIGILASRLKDRFHRPVIAFARAQNGEIKGSGRSIPGLHLRDALDLVSKRHPHLLQKFGGHAMAAGLSLLEENFAEFQQAFEAVAQSLLTPADLTKIIETDGALESVDFSVEMARNIEQQVWGQGFPQPLFDGIFKVESQRVVGEKHLKLKLSSAAGTFEAIHFFCADRMPASIRAVYSLNINEYNGKVSLQLMVKHWQASGE
ncbi:MAG: single-stranded-DNA-specific exonuclease RecJ [Gallionellales bacterium 35-53-114]|jgi:single-stranded-DNA-specific exonuclease|nr:MAG: single-stranded-DNA-specific exonuclease RecJ [Gallionellales bacterium 35-53-114]OYZ64861.1 MAG: single-stranded-DNA-specific exonuclease RecJ [Gallionellales bacterium 24-53-125]OZB07601.1 MAG: single-stranded-DNA-specific exonuclease RecJ [Gallionellales bacterium 39-52-133]HQS58714.1 single-stranded-DNA-specific exonuclease RecJ [Gallionellaceae bacterium]HQS75054.1 single-stranded-DNA-specific exonuclease RecJ [Gallionellaceae bacterium]